MSNLVDIQSQKDNRRIPIDKVGVKNIQYPIVVDDRENKKQHTVADIDLFVSLPATHRGTHMSRFIEVLSKYREEIIIENLPLLLKDLQDRLKVSNAYTNIRFPYFIKKKSPVTRIESLMNYCCSFEASLEEKTYILKIGVEVPVTTLCPCSKELSDYGAHNQRSVISLVVSYHEFVWLEELIEIIESCASSEIYALLKRPDEKYVTEKAYSKPMFVEDVVREVAIKLKKDKRILSCKIETEHFESIHNHNAFASLVFKNKQDNQ